MCFVTELYNGIYITLLYTIHIISDVQYKNISHLRYFCTFS